MNPGDSAKICEEMQKAYPKKFVSEGEIFNHIHRGDRIFISTSIFGSSLDPLRRIQSQSLL
jgi:hypothetical protein